jgi:simple sugar transport system substrate-binding protein/rhamnose transport system substrate-binding protein
MVLFILSLALALVASACGGGSGGKGGGSGSSDGSYTIAVVPKLVGIPYFNASETGAKKAGEDLGVEVIYTGPTEPDAAQQVKVIEDLISKKVDAIAVAPNDPAALTPVLKKAKDAGILVMDWDTPADQSVVELSVHQIDDQQFGEHLVDKLVELMGDSGEFAIVTGGLSANNLNTWIDYGLKHIEANYPGLKLVTERVPSDEKQQVAYQKTLDLLKAYPNLKGFLGYSTPAPLGIAQAIQEKGLQDQIAVVGTALPTDSGPYLEDGSLDVAALWDPGKLGYLTVYLAKHALEGNKVENGMDVPNVGKIEVKSDGKTVIMGPPTDFLKDNYKNYDF